MYTVKSSSPIISPFYAVDENRNIALVIDLQKFVAAYQKEPGVWTIVLQCGSQPQTIDVNGVVFKQLFQQLQTVNN